MIEVYDISWINTEKSAVALGYFDSIHIAHQSLIGQMKKYAEENGMQSAIFIDCFNGRGRSERAGPV